MNKSRALGSTWVGTCVGSVAGSLYFAVVVLQLLGEEASVAAFLNVFVAGMVISVPALLVGSLLIGWWITRFLAGRFKINLVLLFSMAGCLLGLLVSALLAAVDHWLVPGQFIVGAGPCHVVALLLSVPVFYLTVTGGMVGLHVARNLR